MKFDLNNILGDIGALQEKMKETKMDLSKIHVTGESGAGLIKISIYGNNVVKSVEIDPEVLSEDINIIQDLIQSALSQALDRLEEKKENEVSSIYSKIVK